MERKVFGFIGLGLIGGSLARAIRSHRDDCRIMAYTRTRQTSEEALKDGVIDVICSSPSDPMLRACDMIFLCAPVSNNIKVLSQIAGVLSPECILTDVGSVKTGIHEAVRKLGLEKQFIGGHPMTGSEKSGFAWSNPFLFENAYYILTPTDQVPTQWTEFYRDLVLSFKALPLILDYKEHDFITAAVSHLPHVIAASLVNTVHHLDTPDQHMKLIAAGGFRDITRIASSSPEMWEQICVDNCQNIDKVMDEFICLMQQARDHMLRLDGSHIHKMFEESRDYRASFDISSHGPLKKVHRIYCDIIDESGAIATIATILAVAGISIKNIGIVHNREFEEGVLNIEFYEDESCVKAAQILRHHRYTVTEPR